MEIGVRIRALRKARGMKQEDFAEALGVSVQTVSRLENGTNAPDIPAPFPRQRQTLFKFPGPTTDNSGKSSFFKATRINKTVA